MRRIQSHLRTEGIVSLLPENKNEIFGQPYRYLSRGRQAFAFVSEDGKYVLKLPRCDSYQLPFWLRSHSLKWFDKKRRLLYQAKRKRFLSTMESFSLAYELLKEETSLLYLHLHPTDHLLSSLILKDRFGVAHVLDLDKTLFVVQKKESLMIPLFLSSLQKGKREEAQKILAAFLDFVALRSSRGIFNKDGSFLRNFAFNGERVIQIDIGDFYRSPSIDLQCALSFRQTTEHVIHWLSGIDLEMKQWFEDRVFEKMASFDATADCL